MIYIDDESEEKIQFLLSPDHQTISNQNALVYQNRFIPNNKLWNIGLIILKLILQRSYLEDELNLKLYHQ